MDTNKKQKLFAWIAVGVSAAFANFWAYWGINENFHEGWYFPSFWDNLLMMFGQYLLMPISFMLLGFVSIKWNKVGSVIHIVLAVGAFLLFGTLNAGFFFVCIPLVGLSLLYWFGKMEKKKLAYSLILVLPLIQIVAVGTYFSFRVANRYNDNDFSMRKIKGNDVELFWAPEGPGWPDIGTNWYDAENICAHLCEDGKTVSDSILNIWRLPTVDEAVRSSVYHGKNAGGFWNNKTKEAIYKDQPDKESPLWNMHKKTIYWWTSTEVNDKDSYIIVYNGGVWPRMKKLKADYLNFRAVKEIKLTKQ